MIFLCSSSGYTRASHREAAQRGNDGAGRRRDLRHRLGILDCGRISKNKKKEKYFFRNEQENVDRCYLRWKEAVKRSLKWEI